MHLSPANIRAPYVFSRTKAHLTECLPRTYLVSQRSLPSDPVSYSSHQCVTLHLDAFLKPVMKYKKPLHAAPLAGKCGAVALRMYVTHSRRLAYDTPPQQLPP